MFSLWKKFRFWDKKISSQIKKELFGNYFFSKIIFRSVIIILFLLATASVYIDGFSGEYLVCGHNFGMYDGVVCTYPGQIIGDDRSFLTKEFGFISFLIVVLGFLLNHLWFNLGRRTK